VLDRIAAAVLAASLTGAAMAQPATTGQKARDQLHDLAGRHFRPWRRGGSRYPEILVMVEKGNLASKFLSIFER